MINPNHYLDQGLCPCHFLSIIPAKKFLYKVNTLSLPEPILLREIVRFNLASQRSKVQFAPPTGNIYDT